MSISQSIAVRPAVPSDAETIASISNANNEPHFQTTTARKLEEIEKHPDAWLIAEQHGKLVGCATRWHWSENGLDRIAVYSHPEHRDLTINARLLEAIEDKVRSQGGTRLFDTTRADFLKHATHLQSFREVFRSFGAELESSKFDPQSFAHLEPELLTRGIEIKSYSDLDSDPERDAKLEVIQAEAIADLPGFEPVVPTSMDFKNRKLWEPFFIAVRGHDYLGFASLDGNASQTNPHLHIDAGGVSRANRRKGIGLALAAKLMTWAKNQGVLEIGDGGAKSNVAHVKLLERLGFEIEPDWITFEKILT
jgi:ribosomal protein S18 acetylase RimI-like enzyme/N-acetylglutamate synthase-like GNAT family acetyltransferase